MGANGRLTLKRSPTFQQPSSSRSTNHTSRPLAQTSSSSRSEPIIIDSDDSDNEVLGPLASGGEAVKSERAKGKEKMRNGYNDSSTGDFSTNGDGKVDLEAREAIKVALARLDGEIKSVVAQLEPLQALHASLTAERRHLEAQLSVSAHLPKPSTSFTTEPTTSSIDYQSSSFPFSAAILQTLKKQFNLTSFRLCQEGVINAAVDDRDIVCVMPTGGGKSLTYQLPAVMGRGLTVVISPLLALIWDQVRAMKEIGVECVMMTGATSTGEQNEIYDRIKNGPSRGQKELRLCYVTPEKISKSKRLISSLEQANTAGRLRRFVIDEAHCCSQLGHDFRPDYKKLSMLKTLFPRVPIQAVTATLSAKTLPDLLKILRLGPITDGRSAKTTETVFFSAPLFRPNLHYKVISKPSNAKAAIAEMGRWIQAHHDGESGIVYCLSKKDAETVAEELREWSGGGIKTGVYHAGIDDNAKERIHVRWREGKINCICATIAFGLGIDKGDVRYMSKSLEGYYQETGRAGRDGKDSDCVLFYRGQDAARLSSLIYGDVDGTSKLQEMLRFAQDLKTCRKVAFARYFSASAHLSASAWDNADSLSSSGGSISTCGICDNCNRDPESIETRDVTLESWKILKIAQIVQSEGGRVTLANLGDLVRGLGGGTFGVVGGGDESRKKKRKLSGEKGQLSMDEVGGKVILGKDDTEMLLMHLLLLGYLKDSYHATAFSVNVYIIPSDSAVRLTRLTFDEVQEGKANVKVECTFPAPAKKITKKGKKKAAHTGEGDGEDGEDEDEYEEVMVDEEVAKTNEEGEGRRKSATKGKAKSKTTTTATTGTSKGGTKRPSAKKRSKKATNDDQEEEDVPWEVEAVAAAEEAEHEEAGQTFFDQLSRTVQPSTGKVVPDSRSGLRGPTASVEESDSAGGEGWDDGYDDLLGDWEEDGGWKVIS
ncbi:hypothetical protein IAR55_005958 [Kwoniella newhampshirensis]|uniref:ATP-dependent DNA helicase n=1 Tax=Kwoniella newhampshirensis TaxID=1651941 RepID=A0AAW0YVU8_9TREE